MNATNSAASKKAPEFPTSSSLAKVIWKCVHHQKKDKWLFSSFTQAIAHFYNVRDNFSMSSNQRTSEQRKLLMYRLKTLTWRRVKNRMNNDFLIQWAHIGLQSNRYILWLLGNFFYSLHSSSQSKMISVFSVNISSKEFFFRWYRKSWRWERKYRTSSQLELQMIQSLVRFYFCISFAFFGHFCAYCSK